MSWVLLTNDDGLESPALHPFAAALGDHHDVRVIVPERERSWSGKAITRFEALEVRALDGGLHGWAHTGLPADGVQLGAGPLAPDPPSLVVSGINVGYNHGAGYLWSSGTVGAAVEAWALGLPAVAFSTGTMVDWPGWRARVHEASSSTGWRRLAEYCAWLLDEIVAVGLHESADIVNVNLPFDAGHDTERRLTTVARTGYGGLFAANGDGEFIHSYDGALLARGPLEGSDVEAAHDEVVSITPVLMPASARPTAAQRRLAVPPA